MDVQKVSRPTRPFTMNASIAPPRTNDPADTRSRRTRKPPIAPETVRGLHFYGFLLQSLVLLAASFSTAHRDLAAHCCSVDLRLSASVPARTSKPTNMPTALPSPASLLLPILALILSTASATRLRDGPATENSAIDPDPQRLPLKRVACVCSFSVARLQATGYSLLLEEYAGHTDQMRAHSRTHAHSTSTSTSLSTATSTSHATAAARSAATDRAAPKKSTLVCDCKTHKAKIFTFMKDKPVPPGNAPSWDYPAYGGNATTGGFHTMDFGGMSKSSTLLQTAETGETFRVVTARRIKRRRRDVRVRTRLRERERERGEG